MLLEHYRIRNAIPYQWRIQLRQDNIQINHNYNNNIHNPHELIFTLNRLPKSIQHITSSDFYQYLIKNKYTDTPTSIAKWQLIFEKEINFKKSFILSKRVGRTAKLHAFQFSILHQYVPHNYKLHNMKLVVWFCIVIIAGLFSRC